MCTHLFQKGIVRQESGVETPLFASVPGAISPVSVLLDRTGQRKIDMDSDREIEIELETELDTEKIQISMEGEICR